VVLEAQAETETTCSELTPMAAACRCDIRDEDAVKAMVKREPNAGRSSTSIMRGGQFRALVGITKKAENGGAHQLWSAA
jgi:hypothetical protein